MVIWPIWIINIFSGDPIKCAISIGNELGKLTSCSTVWVFTVDFADSGLLKIHGSGKSKGAQWGCPVSSSHDFDNIKLDHNFPQGWAAIHRKLIKLNDNSDCSEYNMSKKGLHSIASCLCKSVYLMVC